MKRLLVLFVSLDGTWMGGWARGSLLARVDGHWHIRLNDRRLDDRLVGVSLLLVRVLLHETNLLADPTKLGCDLLLDETEAHGQDGHAEQHVDGRADHLPLVAGVLEVGRTGHDVAESDRRDCDEAEVGRLQRVPAFPHAEQQRPHEDIPGDDGHGDRERHADLSAVVVVVVFVVIHDERSFRVGSVVALLRLVRILPRLGAATATAARHQRRHGLDPVGRAAMAAAAAADLRVDEAEHVGEDVAQVGETQQHEGDAERGVGDTHQASPERLRRNVAVACGVTGYIVSELVVVVDCEITG